MNLKKLIPWKAYEHPADYKGSPLLCVIMWKRYHTTSVTKDNVEQTVALIDTIQTSNLDNVRKNKGFVSFIDMETLTDEMATYILHNWDPAIPLLLWCDIHKLKLPEDALKVCSVDIVIQTVGALRTNDYKQTRKRKRLVRLNKPSRFHPPVQLFVWENKE